MARIGAALAVAGVGAVGGLAALNRRLELGGGPPDLSGELGGERRSYRWRGGKISYSVAGDPE
ncbi:MAG: hypothetical protein H0V53_14005, partial [Rubrobacter sp.]|nr:hypothetical protein [Rubrobacter sp.]